MTYLSARKGVLLAALLAVSGPVSASADPDQFTQIERGRELAVAGDCVACHTAPGGKPFAGGAMIETPFGNIAAPNITPDGATGIGAWTAGDFARAMHDGVARDGSRLYPAFPYPYYTKVTRADSDAIFAYLRTLDPVHNKVERNTLPFPFNIRLLMAGWNGLFFTPGYFQPDPKRSVEYNRGAYLVDGLAHCGACHTPMNVFGANKDTAYLQGNTLNGWVAPDITNDERTGLGKWSVDDIVMYLKTGRNAHSQASGPMAEVVSNSTSRMDDADLHAMAVYLKQRGTPEATASAPQPPELEQSRMQAGEAVFVDNCSACHKRDGSGVAALFPPLAGSQVVQQRDPTSLIRIVLTGVRGVATDAAPTAPAMPSFAWRLSDQQIADVLTFLRGNWGNAAPAVSAEDVTKLRARFSTNTAGDHPG